MKRSIVLIAGLIALGFAVLARAEPPRAVNARALFEDDLPPPRVIASIKPVQSLAARVMDGIATPDVLLKGAGSAHAYSLRPSEAEALAHADVVFWIGPAFEVFLRVPLKTLSGNARAHALAETPGLFLLPIRPAGIWSAAGAQGQDGHFWLDPRNAKIMVVAMAEALASVDAPNAARYRANADATATYLAALDSELAATLAPVRAKPFIVFHDAIHAFEARYGLQGIGAVTANPERAPSAGVVAALKREIDERAGICVFAEPQFEPKLIQALVAGSSAKTGTLDPEGSTLEQGPDLYSNVLRHLADNLVGCLSTP